MKGIAIIFTAAAVAAACLMGLRAHDEEQASRRPLAAIEAKRSEAGSELAQLQARLDAALKRQATQNARLQTPRPGSGSPAPILEPGSPGSLQKLTEVLERSRQQDMPRVLQYVPNGSYRAAALYAGFFRAVKFTPEQEDEFIRRYFEGEAQIADVRLLVEKRLIAPDDPVVGQLIARFERERETALDALLQPLGYSYRKFKEENIGPQGQIEAARSMVAGTAGVAVLEGVPFTEAQLAELTGIVQQHMSFPPRGAASTYAITVDWPLVDAAARELLSDAQWQVFTKVPGTNGKGAYGGGRFDNALYRAIDDALRSESGKGSRSE